MAQCKTVPLAEAGSDLVQVSFEHSSMRYCRSFPRMRVYELRRITQMNDRNRRYRLGAALGAAVLPVVLFAGGCSSDETDTAAMCSDLSTVQNDLDSLKSIDMSVSNASELGTAVQQLDTDVNSLVSSASDVAGDDVDNLQDAMNDLSDSVSNLGDSGTVADVNTALTNVSTAFDSLESSIDC